MPKRIQRMRKPGWRKPPNTIIVDRRSRWGNPFVIRRPGLPPPESKIPSGRHGPYTVVATREEAVTHFRDEHMTPERRERSKRDLRGYDLACTCKLGEACHADVLLEITNS